MYIYIYTIYLHTYIHAYLPTYIHTYIHTSIHTYIDTYIHTYIHTHTHIPMYVKKSECKNQLSHLPGRIQGCCLRCEAGKSPQTTAERDHGAVRESPQGASCGFSGSLVDGSHTFSQLWAAWESMYPSHIPLVGGFDSSIVFLLCFVWDFSLLESNIWNRTDSNHQKYANDDDHDIYHDDDDD